MEIKIGDTIVHSGKPYHVVNIKVDESVESKSLVLVAYDPDTASIQHQRSIEMGGLNETIVTAMKKLFGGPGGHGG